MPQVLDFVDGKSLEEAVRPESFNEERGRKLFRGLMSALCHLHSQQIIHRDVKPSNIMLTASWLEGGWKGLPIGLCGSRPVIKLKITYSQLSNIYKKI